MKENDLLYISNFSALGDGYKEVEEQWKFLTKTKNVDVVLIDMPLIDTRKGKSAYGPLIADTVLSMLEYVADDENSLRKMRQKEGIALAKERGIIFGRQEKSTPEFQKAYNMWRNKEISAQEAADMCGIHTATFYRRAQKIKKIFWLERLKMDSMSYSITTEFVCRDENYIYAVGRDAAIIFIIDAASMNVKKVMDIPSKHRIRQRLFCGICIAENNIILVPHNIEDIYIYNVSTEKWSTIDISNFVESNLEGKFAGGKFNNGKLYLFGYRYKNILQIDLNTKNIKKMFTEDNHNFWGQSVVEFENHLYAVELENNRVIDINLDAHTLENSIQITESESALDNSNQGIVFDGEYFYLIKHHGNIVYKFKYDGKSERLYIDDFYEKKEPFFNGASIVNKKIFLFSPKGKNYICDLKETSLSKMKDEETFFAYTYGKNGMIICQRGKICILDKNLNVIKTINTAITKLEHDIFFKNIDLSGIVLAENTMFGLDDFVRCVIN